MGWWAAGFLLAIWRIGRHACCPAAKLSTSGASAFDTSTPHMCRMDGMPVSCSRRQQVRCCVETFFTQVGNGPPITDGDIVGPSIGTEDLFRYTSLGPTTGPTIRKLADLKPKVLATMHGSSYSGDGAAALRALGDHYDARLKATVA